MKIKAVVFDLGGVYLNTGILIALKSLSKEYNIPFDHVKEVLLLRNYKDLFSGKISIQEYWSRGAVELGLKESASELTNLVVNSFDINPGMENIVKDLSKKGYETVLLSDQITDFWKRLDKKFQISKTFNLCIISDEVGLAKPDPEIFKFVISKVQFNPEECLFIDDREDNVESAKGVGMKSILFKNPEDLKKDLKKLGVRI